MLPMNVSAASKMERRREDNDGNGAEDADNEGDKAPFHGAATRFLRKRQER
jgi:hypothetical protein